MRFVGFLSLGLLTVAFLAACQTIPDDAVAQLEKPVSCETAEADIAALEAEKVSAAEQAAAGARMVVPAAAVTGILSGDYGNRAKVASGRYNDDLDAKIAEIRAACGS